MEEDPSSKMGLEKLDSGPDLTSIPNKEDTIGVFTASSDVSEEAANIQSCDNVIAAALHSETLQSVPRSPSPSSCSEQPRRRQAFEEFFPSCSSHSMTSSNGGSPLLDVEDRPKVRRKHAAFKGLFSSTSNSSSSESMTTEQGQVDFPSPIRTFSPPPSSPTPSSTTTEDLQDSISSSNCSTLSDSAEKESEQDAVKLSESCVTSSSDQKEFHISNQTAVGKEFQEVSLPSTSTTTTVTST